MPRLNCCDGIRIFDFLGEINRWFVDEKSVLISQNRENVKPELVEARLRENQISS